MRHSDNRRAPPTGFVARSLFALSLCLFLPPLPAQAAPGADDIVVTAAQGDVRIAFSGSPRAATPGLAFELPAAVRTGRDGSVDLRQGDTTLGIGPDTQLDFPAPAESGATIDRVLQPLGNAFYSVGPRRNRRLRVETPYLVAVIKGTQFNVAVLKDSSAISLYEGRLEVLATDGAAPPVELHAGQIAIRHAGDRTIRVLQMKDGKPPDGATTAGAGGDGATTSLKPADALDPMPDLPGQPTPLDDEVDSIIDASAPGGDGGSIDATVALGVDGDPANAQVGAGVDLDLGAGSVNATVGADADLGVGSVSAGLDANADLSAGTVDTSLDAGLDVGAASIDSGVDVAADLGAGTIDATLDAGATLGPVDAGLGADASLDAAAATLDAGVDATAPGTDVGLDVGADLTGSDTGVQIDLGILNSDVGLDLGLGIDAGGTPDAPSTTEESGGLLDGVLRRTGL